MNNPLFESRFGLDLFIISNFGNTRLKCPVGNRSRDNVGITSSIRKMTPASTNSIMFGLEMKTFLSEGSQV